MTGPSPQRPSIEAQLDELLDQLVAGDDRQILGNPELDGLTAIAQAIREDDELEWPEEAYPDQLAATLYSELQPRNGRVVGSDSQPAEFWEDPTVNRLSGQAGASSASDIAELTGKSSHPTGLRKFTQIAAAIVGFGLLTLVLIAVFRGFADDQPAAVGTGSDRPEQLAVAMQTDPVNGNPDIFLISLDGSDPVNLTNSPANDTMPTWSPDGERIAFVSNRNGSDALFVMNADGSNLGERYAPPSEENMHLRNPVWSPDGSSIALIRYSDATEPGGSLSAVIVVDVDSGAWHAVETVEHYPVPAYDNPPVWSPDGRWLAYEAFGDETSRLLIADTSGPSAESNLLTVVAETAGDAVSWSSSNEIAIVSESGSRVERFDPDTTSFETVRELSVPGAGAIQDAKWSPNGTRLALAVGTFSGSTIWVSNSDGTGQIEVPESFAGVFPAWSPDGRRVAFLRAGISSPSSTGLELMIFDLNDESVTGVLDTGLNGPITSPAVWRPTTAELEDEPRATATPSAPLEPAQTAVEVPFPGDILTPPIARLHTSVGSVDAYFGSYSWQFSDVDQTFATIDAPRVSLTGEPTTVSAGEQLVVSIRGEEYTRPPESTLLEVYDFDSNHETPDSGANPLFVVQTDPVMSTSATDPAAPALTLDVPPGRYAIVVRSDWGPHPALDREIFVTWLWDVTVQDSAALPALHIEPGSRTCSEVLRMEASGFPLGDPVTVTVTSMESGESREVGITPRANPDGEFTVELVLSLMYPKCDAEAARPDGLRLQISMTAAGESGNPVEASVEVHVFADDSNEPEAQMDDTRVQQAIQRVRDFLDQPDANFKSAEIDHFNAYTSVHLAREAANTEGADSVTDRFTVEVNQGTTFVALLVSNSALAQPSDPIDVESARAIAEAFYSLHGIPGESLTVVDERTYAYLVADEERYDITWQLQRDGVWLPSKVSITVSLETGLVVSYMRLNFPYDGPLTPEVGEEDARQAAEQIVTETPELDGATVGDVRLEVWLSGADDTVEGRSAADPEMAWRLAWTFTLTDRSGPGVDRFLLIDALNGQKLEPQV